MPLFRTISWTSSSPCTLVTQIRWADSSAEHCDATLWVSGSCLSGPGNKTVKSDSGNAGAKFCISRNYAEFRLRMGGGPTIYSWQRSDGRVKTDSQLSVSENCASHCAKPNQRFSAHCTRIITLLSHPKENSFSRLIPAASIHRNFGSGLL